MALAVAAVSLLLAAPASAKVLTVADGPGGMDTYAILGQHFTIETPDCGHHVPHVTEAYDDVLKKNVFVFHLHVKTFLDDDRCGGKDRQRTEIRGKGADVTASQGETVYYRWKFKLPAGFQSSPNFCHIMQIKSDSAAPIMTLTPRNNATIAMDGRLGANGSTALAPFIDTWMVASMKVTHASNGSWELTIRRISDGAMTFHYAGTGNVWDGNSPQDPKWGIYRSLNTVSALRDEDDVRFADFCISKTSAADCEDDSVPSSDASVISPPPSPDAGAAKDAAENPTPPVGVPDASAPPTGNPGTGGSSPGIPPTGGSGGGEPTPTGGTGAAVPPPRHGDKGGCSYAVGADSHRGGGALAGLLVLGVLALYSRRRR
jgi:MYXO-CTERM domain-containing protein